MNDLVNKFEVFTSYISKVVFFLQIDCFNDFTNSFNNHHGGGELDQKEIRGIFLLKHTLGTHSSKKRAHKTADGSSSSLHSWINYSINGNKNERVDLFASFSGTQSALQKHLSTPYWWSVKIRNRLMAMVPLKTINEAGFPEIWKWIPLLQEVSNDLSLSYCVGVGATHENLNPCRSCRKSKRGSINPFGGFRLKIDIHTWVRIFPLPLFLHAIDVRCFIIHGRKLAKSSLKNLNFPDLYGTNLIDYTVEMQSCEVVWPKYGRTDCSLWPCTFSRSQCITCIPCLTTYQHNLPCQHCQNLKNAFVGFCRDSHIADWSR